MLSESDQRPRELDPVDAGLERSLVSEGARPPEHMVHISGKFLADRLG